MRLLSWIGLIVLILGILAFVVPVPNSQRHDVKLGDASIGITTHQSQKLPPVAGGVMCAAGVVLLIAGARRTA